MRQHRLSGNGPSISTPQKRSGHSYERSRTVCGSSEDDVRIADWVEL
jgi:hypothetical protein